jgi:hypothetical protein
MFPATKLLWMSYILLMANFICSHPIENDGKQSQVNSANIEQTGSLIMTLKLMSPILKEENVQVENMRGSKMMTNTTLSEEQNHFEEKSKHFSSMYNLFHGLFNKYQLKQSATLKQDSYSSTILGDQQQNCTKDERYTLNSSKLFTDSNKSDNYFAYMYNLLKGLQVTEEISPNESKTTKYVPESF